MQTILIALFYGLVMLVLLPIFFVKLNILLSFPIFNFGLVKTVGIILIICGVTIWLHSIAIFHFVGKGTPVPTQSPTNLVIKGLYKRTRNPMYISVLLILLGYFFISGYMLLLLNLVVAAFLFHLFITLYEEPTLKRRFGESYIEYCKKIPRWL